MKLLRCCTKKHNKISGWNSKGVAHFNELYAPAWKDSNCLQWDYVTKLVLNFCNSAAKAKYYQWWCVMWCTCCLLWVKQERGHTNLHAIKSRYIKLPCLDNLHVPFLPAVQLVAVLILMNWWWWLWKKRMQYCCCGYPLLILLTSSKNRVSLQKCWRLSPSRALCLVLPSQQPCHHHCMMVLVCMLVLEPSIVILSHYL